MHKDVAFGPRFWRTGMTIPPGRMNRLMPGGDHLTAAHIRWITRRFRYKKNWFTIGRRWCLVKYGYLAAIHEHQMRQFRGIPIQGTMPVLETSEWGYVQWKCPPTIRPFSRINPVTGTPCPPNCGHVHLRA